MQGLGSKNEEKKTYGRNPALLIVFESDGGMGTILVTVNANQEYDCKIM